MLSLSKKFVSRGVGSYGPEKLAPPSSLHKPITLVSLSLTPISTEGCWFNLIDSSKMALEVVNPHEEVVLE
ncbi:hypothetical protein LOK49_LG07G01949 [Camellia lanceoleosa]|uniref:Uncharacterized protein n=1 Tax=Camellia lanceoleosa TaxID=1840588 RepID=A0ACC0H6D6_9ERIC|nr:hypothetical protein LOK49_LG07G01949 [Camellia lanceoleosa]